MLISMPWELLPLSMKFWLPPGKLGSVWLRAMLLWVVSKWEILADRLPLKRVNLAPNSRLVVSGVIDTRICRGSVAGRLGYVEMLVAAAPALLYTPKIEMFLCGFRVRPIMGLLITGVVAVFETPPVRLL